MTLLHLNAVLLLLTSPSNLCSRPHLLAMQPSRYRLTYLKPTSSLGIPHLCSSTLKPQKTIILNLLCSRYSAITGPEISAR
ncbi:hypothetical protein BDW59DRAFT_155259 [Aspergillus cavernicola]|uniref:Secreted protein n=1 Tax=Aspergillus cavernicola TaxID=176166 RepID=A0ABR4HCE3_9EURO